MKNIIVSLLLLFCNLIFSQDKYYLEGQIGKSKIYLELENSETYHTAKYFYQKSLKNILLEGTKKNDTLVLEVNQEDKIVEKFELINSGTTSFDGFWFNEKGEKLPVTLNSIDFSIYKPNPKLNINTKLDLIKLSLLSFKQDSISKFQGKKILWYSEKHCNSPFFRLGDNFTEKTKAVINPILELIQIENTLSQLNCTSRFEYNTGNGIEYTPTITFLNTKLLGFTIFSSWYCGGAHPDFGSIGYLLDLTTGKSYSIDDILAFDKSVTTEKKGGLDAFSKYRTTFFAPKLVSLINDTKHFKKPDEETDGCDYTDLDSWNFPSWSYTPKGIEFTPYFYRAARSCEEPFLVPFTKLENHKNKTFPYSFK
jgi:hypothetical protein